MSTIIAALTGVILVAVAIEDARTFRIRNAFVLALLGLFIADTAFDHGIHSLFEHVLFGGAGFLLLLAAFARGWIGGGDAKLLVVALLVVGPAQAVLFALALMVSTLAYILGARLGWLPASRIGEHMRIPFGPSIALAWMVTLLISLS